MDSFPDPTPKPPPRPMTDRFGNVVAWTRPDTPVKRKSPAKLRSPRRKAPK